MNHRPFDMLLFVVKGHVACERCTRLVTNEEIYWLFGGYYCRACEDILTHDPEYKRILSRFRLRNIER